MNLRLQLQWLQSAGPVNNLRTGVCEKTLLRRRRHVEKQASEHPIRGWRAVSAARLQGSGSPKGNVCGREIGRGDLDSERKPIRIVAHTSRDHLLVSDSPGLSIEISGILI